MYDIVVVFDTAVLLGLLVNGGEEGVHTVLVAGIGTEQRGIEVRHVLVHKVTARIGVFEVEAEVQAFVRIHGELRVDMVLTAGLVAAVVVEDRRIGREGVHKEELLRPFLDEAVGL